MKTLSKSELIKINGGHNGPAYKAGKAVGEFLGDVADATGKVISFLALKK